MKCLPFGIVLVLVMAAGRLTAQDTAQVDSLLRQLKAGADAEKQLEALRFLATSLDPRIPAACLPLLQSPGASVRRNAARAIGSRWWQISRDQLAVCVEGLKRNLGSPDVQVGNMTRRGIGLLTRKYDDAIFSRSRSKRWVIYERHGKPCVIDTRDHSEELLGADAEANFLPAYGNALLTEYCHWHPKQDLVALDVLIFRRPRLLWVWRPGAGLRSFGIEEITKLLKPAGAGQAVHQVQRLDFKRWKGADLEFTAGYFLSEGKADESEDRTALLRWESATDTLRVQSDTLTE